MARNLMVAEPSAQRCEALASDLHVDAAFQLVIKAARAVHPDFVSVPIKAGYNPIVYQLERVESGVRTVIHLEGAEPGGFQSYDANRSVEGRGDPSAGKRQSALSLSGNRSRHCASPLRDA